MNLIVSMFFVTFVVDIFVFTVKLKFLFSIDQNFYNVIYYKFSVLLCAMLKVSAC